MALDGFPNYEILVSSEVRFPQGTSIPRRNAVPRQERSPRIREPVLKNGVQRDGAATGELRGARRKESHRQETSFTNVPGKQFPEMDACSVSARSRPTVSVFSVDPRFPARGREDTHSTNA